eukprot:CAMPEP_0204831654 /NCGR_PEP_ID=MMETSP1346-20131115/11101_1 /ASSEMBLY_ACC=CAM_ASM_000771 /TAXON_ID=215587 /ORGANISM="Aplanochytrium stocchinoi, Strain GSBS06" /LENGTH=54 /DNA_ID=CAMNT_0051962831 /DNA_START=61 /DNA_END=222 /DNA_ORIENTATION=-
MYIFASSKPQSSDDDDNVEEELEQITPLVEQNGSRVEQAAFDYWKSFPVHVTAW